MAATADAPLTTPRHNLVALTHVMYGMHAFSALMGILTAHFIVTAFLTGWPSIIAIIINYVKRSDARASYLESHFIWQARTFWYALLWTVVAGLLILSFIGIPLAFVLAVGTGIWVLYRIIRGWFALAEHKPIAAVALAETFATR